MEYKLIHSDCVSAMSGTVLDPFMGSGSTGKAAVLEGFNFIGIDMVEEHVEIAKTRISHANDFPEEYQDKPAKKQKAVQSESSTVSLFE